MQIKCLAPCLTGKCSKSVSYETILLNSLESCWAVDGTIFVSPPVWVHHFAQPLGIWLTMDIIYIGYWDPGVMQYSSPPSHLPLLSLSLSHTHTHTQTCTHTSLHVLQSHSLYLLWGNNLPLSRHNRKKQEDNPKMFGRDLFAFCDKLGRELRFRIIGNRQVPRICLKWTSIRIESKRS